MKALSWAWITLGFVWLVTGQVKGCHMTEGEKLVELWFYWLASIACLLLGYWISSKVKP